MLVYSREVVRRMGFVPVYCDLKVASISSAGIERAVFVATFLTSSGRMLRISMMFVIECWIYRGLSNVTQECNK